MTSQVASTSARASVLVEVPVAHAFTVFTEQMASWWPPEHHILEGDLVRMVFEPFVGGDVYDVAVDGRECHWGRVLAYDPPARIVFSWDIDSRWQVENDHSKTSDVEVTFVADGPNRTRVELEHRNLDRHGDGWEAHRDAVSSPGGWQRGLDGFARAAERG